MGHLLRSGVAATVTVLVAGLAAACDPTDELNGSNVSVATRQLASTEFRNDGVPVEWLSCGTTEEGVGTQDATAKDTAQASPTDVRVNCEGRSTGARRLTVRGDVTGQQDLKCERGHLTGMVGTRTVFAVHELGKCSGSAPAGG